MRTQKLVLTAALLAGIGTACGGSGDGKLKRRVNAAHLAPVSAADRAAEAEAQREFFLSEWQVAFTEGKVGAAKLDLGIAKNELASARLAVKNAKLERKAAEESNDQNAISQKQQAERVATLQVEVAKLVIERAKQSRRYLQKRLTHEQRSLRTREAGVELARANSLKAAGIKPPNFDAKKYKTQHAERTANERSAKDSMETEKTKLASVEKRLLGAKNAVAAAKSNPVMEEAPEVRTPMEPLEGEAPPETTPEPPVEAPEEGPPETPSESAESTSTETPPATDDAAPAPDASEPDSDSNSGQPSEEPKS